MTRQIGLYNSNNIRHLQYSHASGIQQKRLSSFCLSCTLKTSMRKVMISLLIKKAHLHKQVHKFHNAWLKYDGWKDVISDKDTDSLYSTKDIFKFRQQCKYLFFAIKLLLHNYHDTTVVDCFQDAIHMVFDFEYSLTDNGEYCARWYNSFNQTGTFQNCRRHNGKHCREHCVV